MPTSREADWNGHRHSAGLFLIPGVIAGYAALVTSQIADGTDLGITIELQPPLATIRLNRPERLNALLPGAVGRYAEALRSLNKDRTIRAIVVTGAGRGFCAGADLAILNAGTAALERFMDEQRSSDVPTTALTIGTPVITAINGPAVGLGFVVAMAADFRIASPEATFSSVFSRLGLVAEYGIAWLLPRLVGLGVATDLLLTGRTITAQEALDVGLINAIAEDPYTQACHRAQELSTNVSPASIRTMKAQLLSASTQDLPSAVTESLALMRAGFANPDLAEALTARAEKRSPQFHD